MSYIKMIDEEKATGKLNEVYESIAGKGRKIAHILKVQSLSPKALDAHYKFYRSIMFGESNLTRAEREMIATVVSIENKCQYWVAHHGAALYKVTKNEKLTEQIKKDFHSAKISDAEIIMLEYAVKLTAKPCAVDEEDVIVLRKVGFNDEAILDIAQVAAYFNFVNRLACGLGIEIEKFYNFGV